MNETNENERLTDEKPPKELSPTNKGMVRLKLIMALLVGLVTAGAGCLTGLYSLRQPSSWVRLPQRRTVWPQMSGLATYLDEYKVQHGSYPLTLEEMTSQWKGNDGEPEEKHEIDYRTQDGWGNPMIYSSNGQTWELLSYGADGKPGGVGLDADIHCTDTKKPEFNSKLFEDAKPTIGQVFRSSEFQSTAVFSVIAGTVGFVLSATFFFRSAYRDAKPREFIIATIGILLATTYFINVYITVQSIASGH